MSRHCIHLAVWGQQCTARYELEATVDKFNDTINSGNGLVARLKVIKNVSYNSTKGQNLPAACPQ